MGDPNLNLAALIGSRICHDLISPIGAINNGVELLEMGGAAAGPEMALISESCASANARIRFFRVAYGAADADHLLGRREVEETLAGVTRGGRLQVAWADEADLPRSEVQLAFLALQCVEAALPLGGRVGVARPDGRWRLEAEGPRLAPDAAPWEALTDPGAPPPGLPAQVQFALLPVLAGRQGRYVSVEFGEAGLSLVV